MSTNEEQLMGRRAGTRTGTGHVLLLRGRGALILAPLAAVAAAAVIGAPAARAVPTHESWAAELSVADGDDIDVVPRDGAIRLRDHAVRPTGTEPMRAEGQLLLAPRRLSAVSDRFAAVLSADQPLGSQTVVSVRGIRSDGTWSTWTTVPPDGQAQLGEPTLEVQVQLQLTAPAGTGDGLVV